MPPSIAISPVGHNEPNPPPVQPVKDEDVPFDPPPGLTLVRTPSGERVEALLAEGELDGLIHKEGESGEIWFPYSDE